MEFEEILRARLDRACNHNAVLGKNLYQLFLDYEKDSQPALNSSDTFDLDQLLDSSLGYYELRNRIEKHLQDSGFYSPRAARLDNDRKMLAEAGFAVGQADKEEKEEARTAADEDARTQFDRSLLRISRAEDIEADFLISEQLPAFRSFFSFMDFLLGGESTYTQGAIISGDAGIGKTKAVGARLIKYNVPHVIFNNYTTPLSFYETAYRNLDKTIVLDDVHSILKDERNVALLKALLFSETGIRLITYSSTSKILEDREIPSSFIFTGRIILIMNEVPQSLHETFQALLNRVYHYELKLTQEEKLKLVWIVFTHSDVFGMERPALQQLFDFMKGLINFSNLHKFNVRTALRAAELWKKLGEARAKDLIMDLLEVDYRMRIFLAIEEKMSGKLPVGQKVHAWEASTGYSRRAYFEMKARYYQTRYGKKEAQDMMLKDVERLTGYMNQG